MAFLGVYYLLYLRLEILFTTRNRILKTYFFATENRILKTYF